MTKYYESINFSVNPGPSFVLVQVVNLADRVQQEFPTLRQSDVDT